MANKANQTVFECAYAVTNPAQRSVLYTKSSNKYPPISKSKIDQELAPTATNSNNLPHNWRDKRNRLDSSTSSAVEKKQLISTNITPAYPQKEQLLQQAKNTLEVNWVYPQNGIDEPEQLNVATVGLHLFSVFNDNKHLFESITEKEQFADSMIQTLGLKNYVEENNKKLKQAGNDITPSLASLGFTPSDHTDTKSVLCFKPSIDAYANNTSHEHCEASIKIFGAYIKEMLKNKLKTIPEGNTSLRENEIHNCLTETLANILFQDSIFFSTLLEKLPHNEKIADMLVSTISPTTVSDIDGDHFNYRATIEKILDRSYPDTATASSGDTDAKDTDLPPPLPSSAPPEITPDLFEKYKDYTEISTNNTTTSSPPHDKSITQSEATQPNSPIKATLTPNIVLRKGKDLIPANAQTRQKQASSENRASPALIATKKYRREYDSSINQTSQRISPHLSTRGSQSLVPNARNFTYDQHRPANITNRKITESNQQKVFPADDYVDKNDYAYTLQKRYILSNDYSYILTVRQRANTHDSQPVASVAPPERVIVKADHSLTPQQFLDSVAKKDLEEVITKHTRRKDRLGLKHEEFETSVRKALESAQQKLMHQYDALRLPEKYKDEITKRIGFMIQLKLAGPKEQFV